MSSRREAEADAKANLRNHLVQVISEENHLFQDLLREAKSNVANDMLEELRSFSTCIQDELSVIQSQFGSEQVDTRRQQTISQSSQRIVQRIFPGCSVSLWTELDSEGVVYGWEDQVNVLRVTKSDQQFLVYITPQLMKSDASNALRLFKFFHESADTEWRNAIISTSCSIDATSVLRENNIQIFDFDGEIIGN